MEWMTKGGPLMWFILMMSIAGLTAAIERMIYFKLNESGNFSKIKNNVKQHIERKELKEAIIVLSGNKNASSRVIKDVLTYWYRTNTTNLVSIEEKAKEAMLSQIPGLEKNMWILSLVAHATPLLGLLGTVTGMMTAFSAVAVHGTGDPAVLAGGISEALITTAGGLFVAIPALVMYNYFNKKIDDSIAEMEKSATEMINFFRK